MNEKSVKGEGWGNSLSKGTIALSSEFYSVHLMCFKYLDKYRLSKVDITAYYYLALTQYNYLLHINEVFHIDLLSALLVTLFNRSDQEQKIVRGKLRYEMFLERLLCERQTVNYNEHKVFLWGGEKTQVKCFPLFLLLSPFSPRIFNLSDMVLIPLKGNNFPTFRC
jgi:hypothetical protein